jgi:predicted phosphoribosyltransferase
VDDGVATGATAETAVRSLKARGASKVILAVPVAAPEAAARLAGVADQLVTVATPEPFWAVGQWFENFSQVSDDEVIEALHAAHRG